jgi:hypothetical protein
MAASEKALALAPRAPHQLTRHESPDIFQTGELLARSGYFADAREAAQAFVKVLAGRELGIGDIAAMTGIYIVKGRVTLSATLMAALVKRSGRYNYKVLALDDAACEIEFYEDGQAAGRSRFTAEDARAAGLGGDNWKRFTRNMLFARAMSNGVKWYCPDVSTAPVYTPDELGAQVDAESGEIIDACAEALQPQAEVLQAEPAPPEAAPAENHATAERRELLERVTARCVELGYDTRLQLNARAKAAKMSDADIKKKVIPSLDKLIEERHREESRLRTAIHRELNNLYKSEEDITAYLTKNCGGVEPKDMNLEQLREAAEGLEVK